MKCPYCKNDTEKGTASLITLQGFGNMMLSFTADKDSDLGFFKRKTKDKIILFADDTKAFYCQSCNKLIVAFDMD